MLNSPQSNNWYGDATYFISIAIAIFAVTFGVLYFFDLVPMSLQSADTIIEDDREPVVDVVENIAMTYPDYISIPAIGVESVVNKPDSPDINVLNKYLASGAVYYPGSGSIEKGNIFIFGHSADLYKGVQNPALKVFNGFAKLKDGDPIIVTADGVRYVYTVSLVQQVTEDDALVTFDTTKRKLTLSTCNTFGQKQDRIVVEADFSHIL